MMLQSNSDTDGNKTDDVHSEENIRSCSFQIISNIISQIIEDLPVFTWKSHEEKESCISKITNFTPAKDYNFQRSKLEKGHIVTGERELTSYSENRTSDTVNSIQDVKSEIVNVQSAESEKHEYIINNSEKELLLSALHLSPVPEDISKEVNVEEINVQKKRESVHFTSPVAVVYEFSERSEAVSDVGTDILSDSDSEDFPLSQTICSENTEIQNQKSRLEAFGSEPDIRILLNDHETCFDKDMNDCIMTAGGDCYNASISENNDVMFEPNVEQIENIFKENKIEDYEIEVTPDNCNDVLNEKKEEYAKDEIEETTTQLQKQDLDQDKRENEKIPILSETDRDNVTESAEVKSEVITLEHRENKEVPISNLVKDCNSENKLVARESFSFENCNKDIKSHSVLYDTSLVLSSPSSNEPAHILPTPENKCQTLNNDVNEVFAKFLLEETEDKSESSQDLFLDFVIKQKDTVEVSNIETNDCNYKECKEIATENETNLGTDGSQHDLIKTYLASETVTNEELKSTIDQCKPQNEMIQLIEHKQIEGINKVSEESDMNNGKESNDITKQTLLHIEKREQSSPYLHFSQIAKKSRTDLEDVSATNTAAFTRKRKLVRLELDGNMNVKLPKLDNESSNSDNLKTPKLLKQLASDVVATLDDTVIWDSTKSLAEHVEKHTDLGEEQKNIITVSEHTINDTDGNERKLLASQLPEDLQMVRYDTRTPCEPETDQREPETDQNACTNITQKHIICNQTLGAFQLETSKEDPLCEEHFLESQGFISATELHSQSSQESGSTGFTVYTGNLSCTQDKCEKSSLEKSEIRQFSTNEDLLKEKIRCRNIEHLEQELEHEDVTTGILKSKSVVELTEDGLMEEELVEDVKNDSFIDMMETAETVDSSNRRTSATDQEEQIDTDQLDMFVERAVDQIVPDECIDTTDQKPKLYACDFDLCDEQDKPVCKPVNKYEKSYEKCFKWKYRPSCDLDSDAKLPELPDEDHVVTITPLKTCGKPLRLGLSRRQPVKNSLHKFGMRK